MIYAWGPLSGLHINPAVTFAFAFRQVFPPGWVLPYWAAQFAGAVGGPVTEFYFFQPLLRALQSLRFGFSSCQQWHGDVFDRRKLGQKVVKLPHIPDFPISKLVCLPACELIDVS